MNRMRPSRAAPWFVPLIPVLLLGQAAHKPVAESPIEFEKNLVVWP